MPLLLPPAEPCSFCEYLAGTVADGPAGHVAATTDRVRNRVTELLDDVARGELQAVIDRRFSLAEATAAHAYIESRQAVGRVLLIP